MTKREQINLPLEERRKLMEKQAEDMAMHYKAAQVAREFCTCTRQEDSTEEKLTTLIEAALLSARNEALEEAALAVKAQLDPISEEFQNYSTRRCHYSGDCKDADLRARVDVLIDAMDNIRSLIPQRAKEKHEGV